MTARLTNANFSPEDREVITAALTAIREKLPFLVDLSPEQRRALPKMGDKGWTFVSRAMEVAAQNPNFLPRSFDLDELRHAVALYEALYPLWVTLTQLQELVEDTCMVAKSAAYTASLAIYSYAKLNSDVNGLDTMLGELRRQFPYKTRKKSSEKPPT